MYLRYNVKIISQITMFDDTQNENLGDLEWLQVTVQRVAIWTSLAQMYLTRNPQVLQTKCKKYVTIQRQATHSLRGYDPINNSSQGASKL